MWPLKCKIIQLKIRFKKSSASNILATFLLLHRHMCPGPPGWIVQVCDISVNTKALLDGAGVETGKG